ncbi:PIG-L family deacetylase [Blastopirellula sp. JC732]|uniref:PIG-L family deacetylase n=1 Tax=Blastopirellula sediminis TaxID=2894196 RepID=A0A9X1MR47_9BACT|nr:PIG-L family deacetylase [Blastopirellula sediminis]MCC9605499.1 PIG-L family deacetylase [Blastopirellula sediminis]MCC9631201.1 PIG-L family deacetylase [Blastopirellula sediminis]
MTRSVLAVAAHPDDIEFMMAGALMALADVGYELHYWNIADGCCGSLETDRETTARIRLEEAKTAAASIGATFHPPLCADLEVFYNLELLSKVTSVIREIEPQIILTHAPSDYMEDHMQVARLAVTGAFSRGIPNFPVDPPRPIIGQKVTVYHAQPYQNRDPLGKLVMPELFVDTTDLVERKVEMLACHKSQKEWLDKSQGLGSYLEALRNMDRQIGGLSEKFAFAEGYRRHLYAGFCDPGDDPLSAALAERALRNPAY